MHPGTSGLISLTTLLTVLIHLTNTAAARTLSIGSTQATSTNPSSTTFTTTTPPPELPDFLEPIGNHTVPVGRDAQLACRIAKLGRYKTAWLRVDDKGILTIHDKVITRNYRIGLVNNPPESNRDEQEFVLSIKNVEPSDRGGYMCQINSVPMKYALGYLEVLTPPVFEQQPEEGAESSSELSTIVSVKEGATASLTCRASGRPTPQISWRREDNRPILMNGNVISPDDLSGANQPLKVDGASLNLSQVSRVNSGAYLCIAANGVQPSASRRQVLDVQFRPVIRLPQRGVGAAPRQNQARLSCFVELNPAGSYFWVKVPGSGGSSGQETPYRGSGEPQGDYSQTGGSFDDLALIEHEAISNNSDKYEVIIRPTGAHQELQMSLVIRNLERQDFGLYKCIARNELGVQSADVRLYPSQTGQVGPTGNSSSSSSGGSTPPSSTFSLNSLFRFGSRAETGNPEPEVTVKPASSSPSRTMIRSSWVSRSTSGASSAEVLARSRAQASCGAPPLFVLLILWLALCGSLV